jgi:hypothetical protein
MDAVLQLSSTVGIESACDVLGVARASYYRQRPLFGPKLSASPPVSLVRPTPARALSMDGLFEILELVNFPAEFRSDSCHGRNVHRRRRIQQDPDSNSVPQL